MLGFQRPRKTEVASSSPRGVAPRQSGCRSIGDCGFGGLLSATAAQLLGIRCSSTFSWATAPLPTMLTLTWVGRRWKSVRGQPVRRRGSLAGGHRQCTCCHRAASRL